MESHPYIRTLPIFLIGFRLFGASQSSTEALFQAIQTANNSAVKLLLSTGAITPLDNVSNLPLSDQAHVKQGVLRRIPVHRLPLLPRR
jgi:hypothetical protein